MTAPVQPTSSDRSIRAAGPAAPARRRARRTAVRLAGLTLAAGTVLGGLGPAAHAESPPAPKPTLPVAAPKPGPAVVGPVADAPPGPNTGRIFATAFESGDTWSDVTFRSNRATVIVQISTTKPHWEGDVLTMGAVSPVVLHGTPVPSAPNTIATGPTYSYKVSPEGLTPATTYHVLASIPGSNGQKPAYGAAQFATKKRFVRMTPMATHVSNDSDKGANNGEIHFGARVAPDGDSLGLSWWGGWTKTYSVDSGDDIDLAKANIGHTVTTKAKTVTVQVQGIENDVQGWDWDCAIQGGEVGPRQYSDHCYDTAYAEAFATLPTTRYQGAHQQVVEAKVSRGPALEFQTKVLVETWYGW